MSRIRVLFAAAVCWPLVPVFAWVARWALAGASFMVLLTILLLVAAILTR